MRSGWEEIVRERKEAEKGVERDKKDGKREREKEKSRENLSRV